MNILPLAGCANNDNNNWFGKEIITDVMIIYDYKYRLILKNKYGVDFIDSIESSI